LKTPSGEVKGGIYALSWAGMLFIKWLWIDEAYRRHGHGRKLMAAAEEEGRRRGCTAVWLDTFEFQARPFYEKLGYSQFGTLDYPAGFKRFFLQKAL
jgi:GNAT superfamily N-acetyltransferase